VDSGSARASRVRAARDWLDERTRQHPENWAKDRYEWLAAMILLLPFASVIVLLSLLGVGYAGVLIVAMIFGVPASGARRRLASRLRKRS
jgi:hypothetical protein